GADNSSGFTGLPGGYRGYTYLNVGNNGNWWSSTQYSSTFAYGRHLHHDYSSVFVLNVNKTSGLSVRCVRD
ncbi:MAG: FISUMP domain-containing protein, partial [Bacteroidota bacterium]